MRKSFLYHKNKRRPSFSFKVGRAGLFLLLSIFLGAILTSSSFRALAADELPDLDKLTSDDVPTPDSKNREADTNRSVDEVTPLDAPTARSANKEENSDDLDLEKALDTGPDDTGAKVRTSSRPATSSEKSAPPSEKDLESASLDPSAPTAASSKPPKFSEAAAPPGPAQKNQVSNLEFQMEGDNSKIIVSFTAPPVFREVKNEQIKQIVYFFDNTECPQRLQRAYDTSEFISPVTLFTMLQVPGALPQSKLIVQLREDKAASAAVSGNSLVVTLPASDIKPDAKTLAKDDQTQGEENIYSGGKEFAGKPINRLEIKNSDIQDVLRLIARSSGYNIVVGDDVQGKVGTLSLENIPWDQAFTLVLQSKKLGYVRQGNVLRVGTLQSLKAEKDESLANEQARIRVEQLKTLLIPVSYAKANDLAPRAKAFLTERGTIETDGRTNTLIVRDIEKIVGKIQKLVAALDTQPPRVSISAKIVEMDDDFQRNVGFSNFQFQPAFGGINVNTGFTTGVSGGSVTTITAPNFASLTATLQLGEIDNRVKVLANPQVSVVANQSATVTQSLAFFIPTTQIVAGTPTITYNQITTNLTLDVTPIVSSDGVIFLTLSVKNETPSGPIDQRTIDGRNLSTQVMVDNGDTAVIGGIFSDTVTTSTNGVPFISNIPILGWLFSGVAFEDKKNEIYMFLTAKILNAEETFKRTI